MRFPPVDLGTGPWSKRTVASQTENSGPMTGAQRPRGSKGKVSLDNADAVIDGATYGRDAARSKRSRFITLVQAATKSWTNLACASELPYTSERARSCALEPKIRSARVAVQRTSPVLRSRPSNALFASETAFHAVCMSSRLIKKSLVNASGFLVKTPNLVCP